MNISILTVFSQIYDSFLQTSLIKRAQEAGTVSFDIQEFFSFCEPKERIDSPTFGHGAGMVIKPEVVQKAVEKQETKHGKAFKIFLSPQGKKLDQDLVEKLTTYDSLTMLCGRYEGIDERVIENDIDYEVSIGDYVISGGELAAMVVIDTISRRLPNVLGNEDSLKDSFTDNLLDYPHYTRPEVVDGHSVPEVLLSGNQAKIDAWRLEQSIKRTKHKRPDLKV